VSGARPRLSRTNLRFVRAGVAVPDYDPAKTSIGIVHFGPGSFFRSHVAWYFDRLLAHNSRWAIAAVSLRSGGLAASLAAQDNLYTLVELGTPERYRIIGAVGAYLAATETPDLIFHRLCDPNVRAVTLTVTEKAYCLDVRSALDLSHPDIRHDLAEPARPKTPVGWIVESLSRRRAASMAPFLVISCDNLAENGPKLRASAIALALARGDTALARWIETSVRFPATMVDSITPHMTEALKEDVAEATGLADEAPIARESFIQWVIEDTLGPDAPDLAIVGATLTRDVVGYEQAKLRLLNGAHSALAYLGVPAGYETVDEAMADRRLSTYVERLMREDMAKTLRPGVLDYERYIDQILMRFRNPAIKHKLRKIAEDGSSKIPQRFLTPIAETLTRGGDIDHLAVPIAAWFRFAVLETKAGRNLDDPLAARLAAAAASTTGDAGADVNRFLALADVFPRDLASDSRFAGALAKAYAQLTVD
jgi:fructuronate reductase